MKKLLALATFVLLMGLSVMVVHADIGHPVLHEVRWVTAYELNVRWEPNMQSAINAQVYQFERVVVERRFGSGDLAWYHIRLQSDVVYIRGWVFGGWLSQLNEFVPPAPTRTPEAPTIATPAAPAAPVAPAPVTPTGEERTMRVTAGMLNVRTEPNMQSRIITAIPQDSWVAVNPYDRDRVHGTGEFAWFYARLVGSERQVSGWVFSGFLSSF